MPIRFTPPPAGILAVAMLGAMLLAGPAGSKADDTAIPHAQDRPPNEPRDPQTAARMMTVPEGFVVEVVAAEPDLVNPVAMAIDERGRFWIAESVEYPRERPGPGSDHRCLSTVPVVAGTRRRVTVTVAVKVKEPRPPRANVALFALVIAGAVATVPRRTSWFALSAT